METLQRDSSYPETRYGYGVQFNSFILIYDEFTKREVRPFFSSFYLKISDQGSLSQLLIYDVRR